jgi:hypothetical protein
MYNKATLLGTLSTIFAFSAILMGTPYLNSASAQTPGEAGSNASEPYFAPLNMTGPETATEFEDIAGSDAAILANDTDISNPNNTMLDATGVNIQEDCMEIPGNTAEDCP